MIDVHPELEEIVRRCDVSRRQRQETYRWLRTWYTRGSDRSTAARFNRLRAHVSLLGSYLYAPEGTRFSVLLPPQHRAVWAEQSETARAEFARVWRDSGADVTFDQLVEWALVYGCTIGKVVPSAWGPQIAYVDPGYFGVLREDLPSIEQQEAFAHWFHLGMDELARLVAGSEHEAAILDLAHSQSVPGGSVPVTQLPSVIQQVVVTSVSGGSLQGTVDVGRIGEDRAVVEEPTVELVELWRRRRYTRDGVVFDDYEVTTMLGQYVILQRRNPIFPWASEHVPAECPFIKVAPEPYPDYFWGASAITGLIPLQEWREQRMNEIDSQVELALDPPKFFVGVPTPEEKLKALRTPGGMATSPQPGGKMDVIKIELPQAAFESLGQIDQMFREYAGVPEILSGGDAGARSEKQATAQANIAVGRIRKKALHVEDAIAVGGSRMFSYMQRNDGGTYKTDTGKEFLLRHLPNPRMVVSAHSSSPVYAEQTLGKAQVLLQAGAIDLPTFVELVDPPRVEDLRAKAKELQAAQAELAKKKLEIEEKKATRPARR